MRTSSARQLELEGISANPVGAERGQTSVPSVGAPTGDDRVVQSTVLNVPDFGTDPTVYAMTSRLAGRINAAAVSDLELNRLLHERQVLLDKLFDGTISRKEQHRLKYVRWSLDRIEDARYGSTLDVLSDEVSVYERLAADIASFKDEVMRFAQKSSKRKRGRG
jgi:hypothetical protein